MSITTALEARRDAALRDRDGGFTLIELLVVVIIIGILAAIAVPIYLNVQNEAKDKAAHSDLSNARTAVIAFYSENSSFPSAVNATVLGKYGFVGPSGKNAAALPVLSTTGTQTIENFCLKAVSDSTKAFYMNATSKAEAVADKPANCTT